MKAKHLLFAALVMMTGYLSAQNPGQEFTDRMNYIFQPTDKSRVTTGLLSDYGLQMVEPGYFNGVPADSNYVNMDTWKMLYSGIYTSKINSNISLTSPETVFTQIESTTHATAVPVAMMHYQYNQLNENAVNLGLLQVVNDQIIDVPGAASPYLTKQLFAVAPKALLFDGPTARFVFKSNLFYKNVNKTVQKREINFNNESGYLTANWDSPLSYTFSSGGIKAVYFRLTYTDGTSYTSRTNIQVTEMSSLLKSAQAGIDSVLLPATSQHSGGKMQIRLSGYNTSGQIKKPLIVAEGFDASCIMSSIGNVDINNLIDFSNDIDSWGTINVPYPGGGTLLNKIDIAQYDIIYLDYKNGVDDIFRNAQLFREVIQYVNSHKQGSEPNVVMGISMGGLVARIALRQMEQAGVNHQTWKYISVDSPHKGANVPIGYQAAVRHIQNTNLQVFFINVLDYNNSEYATGAVNLLNSMAAKQMLIYSINQNYGFDNTVHTSFQQAYDNLGFPQQCQNIAIANGSNNTSLNFAPGSAIVDLQYSYSFKWWMDALSQLSGLFIVTNYPQLILNAIPGHSQVKVELNVDALKNKTASRIYRGKVYIRKKLLFFIPVNINLVEKTVNSTGSMLPIDGAPGGLYSLEMLSDSLPPIILNAIEQPQFCFVPTVSSLALNDWETRLTQNLSGVSTPFFATFAQGNNQLHTRFNSSASFLYNQLTASVIYPTITGPDVLDCGSPSAFTISYAPTGYTWTCSSNLNPGTASGNSKIFTATGSGTSGWVAINANGTELVRKTVSINLPIPPVISGSSTLGCSQLMYTEADHRLVNWSVQGALQIVGSSYGWKCMIKGTNTSGSYGSGWIYATDEDCSSVRGEFWVDVSCGSYYLVFSPNPTTDETTITIESDSEEKTLEESAEWELGVYDNSQNMKIKKSMQKSMSAVINTHNWMDGVYTVRAKYKNEIITGKLVVKK